MVINPDFTQQDPVNLTLAVGWGSYQLGYTRIGASAAASGFVIQLGGGAQAGAQHGASQRITVQQARPAELLITASTASLGFVGFTSTCQFGLTADVVFMDGTVMWGARGEARKSNATSFNPAVEALSDTLSFTIAAGKPINYFTLYAILRYCPVTARGWVDSVAVRTLPLPAAPAGPPTALPGPALRLTVAHRVLVIASSHLSAPNAARLAVQAALRSMSIPHDIVCPTLRTFPELFSGTSARYSGIVFTDPSVASPGATPLAGTPCVMGQDLYSYINAFRAYFGVRAVVLGARPGAAPGMVGGDCLVADVLGPLAPTVAAWRSGWLNEPRLVPVSASPVFAELPTSGVPVTAIMADNTPANVNFFPLKAPAPGIGGCPAGARAALLVSDPTSARPSSAAAVEIPGNATFPASTLLVAVTAHKISASTVALAHSWGPWLTRGVYHGHRIHLVAPQFDDLLLDTRLFDPTTGLSTMPSYRASGSDLLGALTALDEINAAYGTNVTLELAFNTKHIRRLNNDPTGPITDSLFSQFMASSERFFSLSHSWSHRLFNWPDATYLTVWEEVKYCLDSFRGIFGVSYAGVNNTLSPRSIVTPGHTGYHMTGTEKSGRSIKAMVDNGVDIAVGSPSNPVGQDYENIYHTKQTTYFEHGFDGHTLIPRHFTGIGYDVSLRSEQESQNTYNSRFGWGLVANESLDNTLLRQCGNEVLAVLRLEYGSFMFHQANLRMQPWAHPTGLGFPASYSSATGRSLALAWLDNILRYARLVTLAPIRTIKQDDVADLMAKRYRADLAAYTISTSVINGTATELTFTVSNMTPCNLPNNTNAGCTASLRASALHLPVTGTTASGRSELITRWNGIQGVAVDLTRSSHEVTAWVQINNATTRTLPLYNISWGS